VKILVCDRIHKTGEKILEAFTEVDVKPGLSPDELVSVIGDYDAVIVRSQTKITAEIIEAGAKLKVIGRAGVGIDNIDVDAATRQGIVVVNSPEGNIVSTAEHTIALMLALARGVPQAHRQLHDGVWDRSFKGVQIRNKNLGVIGLGRVGTQVAEMGRSLHMNVIAYDPITSETKADALGIKMVDIETLLKSSDFVTLHVPLNASTRDLIGEEQLKLMKPSALIINCARGGIINETDLLQALEHKLIAGAAIDVFSKEPAVDNILLQFPNVVTTPHLAASTTEAEERAGIDIAEEVVGVLQGLPAKSPVNLPPMSPETLAVVGPYIQVGTTIAKIAVQLMAGQLTSITIRYQGEIVHQNTDPIKASVLAGILNTVIEERVNLVNADFIARSRGLKIEEQKENSCEYYPSMVTLTLETNVSNILVSGAFIRNGTRLVRVSDFWFEIEPSGSYLLFTKHQDRPGMIGLVGALMGEANVNISQMQVSRGVQRGGPAMMVLCLDDPIGDDCLQQILSLPGMITASIVRLN
jgi:D-3-phosphoglycerate dehydrogenase / 2-oxoglutarate reductase